VRSISIAVGGGDLQPVPGGERVLRDATGSVEFIAAQNEADIDLAAVAHGAVEGGNKQELPLALHHQMSI